MMASVTTYSKRAWEKWKAIAHKIGNFQSRLLLSVFYFMIVGPVAIVFRTRSDPLHLRSGSLGGWIETRGTSSKSMEGAQRQG